MSNGPRNIAYTREELIEALCRYADLLGEAPGAGRLDKDSKHVRWLPSLQPYKREFGTWNKALEAAGIESEPQPAWWAA